MGNGTLALIMFGLAVPNAALTAFYYKHRTDRRYKKLGVATGSAAIIALLLGCLLALQYRDGTDPEHDATLSTIRSQLSTTYHVLAVYQDDQGKWHAHVSDKLNASCTGTLDLHVSGNSLYGSGEATYADLECKHQN